MNYDNSPILRHPDMIRRMIPNRLTYHKPGANHMRDLMQRIGKSQVWVAERTGISRRRIQYLLVGSKVFAGVTQEVKFSYPEQYILECLADAGEAFGKSPKPDSIATP